MRSEAHGPAVPAPEHAPPAHEGPARGAAGRSPGDPARDWLTARRIHWLAFCGAVLIVFGIIATHFAEVVQLPQGKARHVDFAVFWTTSLLSLEGTPELAYDFETTMDRQRAAYGRDDLDEMPWIYPPTFQILTLPLGLMPLLVAKTAWNLATCAFFLAVAGRILPGRTTLYAALAMPITFMLFFLGQGGFLTAGLLGLGLLHWDRRPVLAGVALGLLSFKPQLAVGVPLAAIAGRHWRLLLSSALAALGFALVAWALFGTATWEAFPSGLARARQDFWTLPLEIYASAYAGLRALGLGFGPAMAGQVGVALVAMVAVVRGFRRSTMAPDARAALLAYGTVAMSPRVLDYDLMILFIGALFQVRQARALGFYPGEKLGLLAAVLACYADIVLPIITPLPGNTINSLVPLVLLLGLLAGECHRPGLRHAGAGGAAVAPSHHVLRDQAGRLVRFGIVGVGGTATHVLALTALVELAQADPRIANLLAFAVAVPVSYLGHYYWSFGSTHPHGATILRFLAVAAASLVGTQGLMLLALDVAGAGYGAGIALIVVVMPLVNFAVQQVLVFRRRAGGSPAPR